LKGQKGLTLLETLIALTILSVIALSIFLALDVSHKTTATVDKNTTAESLTRTALEIIKQCEYDATNNPPLYQDPVDHSMICDENMTIPDGYDIVVTAERLDPENDGFDDDDGIQKVTVDVDYDGEEVMTTEDYKADR